jgi:hypothetical protein
MKELTLILAAGTRPQCRIRGKLAAGWVIESAGANAAVVIREDDAGFAAYLASCYPELRVIRVDTARRSMSIAATLAQGLDALAGDACPVRVLMGDTLLRFDEAGLPDDYVMTSDKILSSERWCLAQTGPDGNLARLWDKQPGVGLAGKAALVGCYRFADPALLRRSVDSAMKSGGRQMSDVLDRYMKKRPIACVPVDFWLDLGHTAGVIEARNTFFNSRDFNSMLVEPVRGTIKKISGKRRKLADEFAWYRDLPPDLAVLVPRVVGFEDAIDHAALEMEMYGYPPLSELFVMGELGLEELVLVLDRLFHIHRLMEGHKGRLPREAFRELYCGKTVRRVEELKNQGEYWKRLMSYETITVNGRELPNLPSYMPRLLEAAEALAGTAQAAVVHGDYCFNNILFDIDNFVCRLIDPRGRLIEQTIYGDPRYDIAKLRHSVVGGYDFAVHNRFNLADSGGSFTVEEQLPPYQDRLKDIFDGMAAANGYDVEAIKLIEAMLFASMIPLHRDDIDRQKLFYVKAARRLAETLGE